MTAAAVAFTAALATVSPLAAGTALAAPSAPSELVIPAEQNTAPDAQVLHFAGWEGFLRGDWATGYRWVSFEDGTSVPYKVPQGDEIFGTGRDLIAQVNAERSVVRITDPRGYTYQNISVPPGQGFRSMMGTEVLTEEYEGDSLRAIRAVSLVDGAVKERTVTGLPVGATNVAVSTDANPKGFVVRYQLEGRKQTAWVDSRSLTVHPLADVQTWNAAGDHVFVVTPGKRLQIWDAGGDWAAPAYDIAWPDGYPVGLVGSHVISRTSWTEQTTLVARPLNGTAETVVLDKVDGDITATPDKRLLAVRFGGDTARTVHSIGVSPDGGPPVVKAIHDVPRVSTSRHRIALAQGELHSVDQIPWEQPRLRTTRLSVDAQPTAGPAQDRGGDAGFASGCATEEDCPVPVPTGDGRLVRQSDAQGLVLLEAGKELPGTTVVGEGVIGDLEASGRYASYLSLNGMQKVYDLDARKLVFTRGGFLGQPTSLAGRTLWAESAAEHGTLDAFDVRTGNALPSVKVADCALKDLQVHGSSAYWKCDTASGVTDLNTKTTVALPAHDSALLGDGYVAHAKSGTLSLTPLRGPVTATRTIGEPADARPGRGWAVDRFGGHLAWVDAQQRTHVVPSGVETDRLFALDSAAPATVLDRKAATPQTWSGGWWLSRPVRSWSVDIVNDAGNPVRTLYGGAARGLLNATWDGTDSGGTPLPDGLYTWHMSAMPETGTEIFSTYGDVSLIHLNSLASGRYQPVTPARVMDTRDGTGVPKAKVGPGGTVTLQVTGRGGVPATGVTAVVLNVTATNPTSATYVSVYPYGTTRSSASNLNVVAGQTVPNLVVVPVKGGKVTFYNRGGSVDLLADVAGFYWPVTSGSLYEPVTPTRVMDTRTGTGVAKAKVGAGKTVTLTVAGQGGVPAGDVTAVVLNVTATNPTSATYVSVYPYGTTRTSASNLNVVAGQTVPNLVVVPVKGGKVTFYNHNGSVDLLADVAGYYTSAGVGSLYEAVAPARLMDTRTGTGVAKAKVGAGKTVTLTVAGQGGVPAGDVTAVVLNVTATNPTSATYVSVYPYGTTRTSASNLNVVAGQTVPNLVVVPVKGGKVTFYNHNGSVDLLADVAGYYAL
ncbi:FlgD immunoglobulin-like domain containing protein [Streptomyces sp. NPDC085481]|uniref:FlgD immunoglobulin-like domain containing protein n=1 Tax=Streptomyces sp. NPDC085481 TaxID=3365727 RepID=UPI0037CF9525